jgi:(1->4)-alpha-D-glucan 1-alpha-D-glucosylmutase
VVAEKILSEAEPLPREWAVAGTVGYDFLAAVNNLFTARENEAEFDRLYRKFAGGPLELSELIWKTKRQTMIESMAGEINSLAHRLDRLTERNRHYRDFTFNSLRFAIREVIAALPVYRTYITDPGHVPDRDRLFIETAVGDAKGRNPGTAAEVFDFLADLLLLRNLDAFAPADRELVLSWVLRFQQMTGPIMAKGVEDTAFYIYNRLVSLNEVGGHPDHFGISIERFHALNQERQSTWPDALLATSTHDTKRSEDVRARLAALSEMPAEWEAFLDRWRPENATFVGRVDRRPAPSQNDQYLVYQTLVGVWPPVACSRPSPGEAPAAASFACSRPSPGEAPAAANAVRPEDYAAYRQRVTDYMHKATKEAKVHTSWINANRPYDDAVRNFVAGLLPENGDSPFALDLRRFAGHLAHFGYLNSLAQLVLKLTCPGVPDIYQGCDLWDFSLVDPDNRRPVDFDRRRQILHDLRARIEAGDLAALAAELLGALPDGRVKLYVLHRLLEARRQHPEVFAAGRYEPLAVQDIDPDSVLAFARVSEDSSLLVVVSCRPVRLLRGEERLPIGDVWQNTRVALPGEGPWRNLFTGEVLAAEGPTAALADVFRSFPVAVLFACSRPSPGEAPAAANVTARGS